MLLLLSKKTWGALLLLLGVAGALSLPTRTEAVARRLAAPPSGAAAAIAPGDATPQENLVSPRVTVSLETTPDAAAVATFDTIESAGGDWFARATNERGDYAWQESYVLRAYLVMYRATGETRYLDKFVAHATAVVDRTDAVRGVRDYRGRSLPAWRAGAHYTYARLYLTDGHGKRVIRVDANRTGRNDSTRVIVVAGSVQGTFTLGVRNSWWGRSEIYRNLSMSWRSPNYFARRINGRSRLVRVRHIEKGGTPRPFRYSKGAVPLQMAFAVHTGMIAHPLAEFARMVNGDPALQVAYSEPAARCLSAAVSAMSVHDEEWKETSSTGYYVFPRGAPIWSDGVELPHNQNLAMGRALVELYRATGVDSYLTRARKLGALFSSELRDDVSGAYVWDYWWGRGHDGWAAAQSPSVNTPVYRGYRAPEDVSHGAISVDFVNLMAGMSAGFDDADRVRFANTFHSNMTGADGGLSWYVTGTGRAGGWSVAAGDWLGLAGVSRDVFLTAERTLTTLLTDKGASSRFLHALARHIETQRAMAAEPRALLAPRISMVETPTVTSVAGDFTLAVQASGGTTPTIRFFVDQQMVDDASAQPHRRVWRTSSLADGWHVFGAVASDGDGRTHAVRVSAVVDNTPPVLRAASVRPRAISPNGDGCAEWAIVILDASEEAHVRVRLIHSLTGAVVDPPRYTVTFRRGRSRWAWNGRDVSGRIAPEGRYRLVMSATDGVGNFSRTGVCRIDLNNTLRGVAAHAYRTRRGPRARITFTLRRSSYVSISIAGRGSRIVRRVLVRSPRRSGRQTLYWDCRDGRGRHVRRGTYVVTVAAANRLGSVAIPTRLRVR